MFPLIRQLALLAAVAGTACAATISAYVGTGLTYVRDESASYAHARARHDFVYDWVNEIGDPMHGELHYAFEAEGRPRSVSSSILMQPSGDLPGEFDVLSGFAHSIVRGVFMITGGEGHALVKFLLHIAGENSCVYLGTVDQRAWCGVAGEDFLEFGFNEPIHYTLQTSLSILNGYEPGNWEPFPQLRGSVELTGIEVVGFDGHPIPEARLIDVPEPAAILLTAAGLALAILGRMPGLRRRT